MEPTEAKNQSMQTETIALMGGHEMTKRIPPADKRKLDVMAREFCEGVWGQLGVKDLEPYTKIISELLEHGYLLGKGTPY